MSESTAQTAFDDVLCEALAGLPRYRRKQAKEQVFRRLIADWAEATNLPAGVRDRLQKAYPLGRLPSLRQEQVSADDRTIKALFVQEDGARFESVLMRHEGNRRTVCVSSQSGCPLGCAYCATGRQGFHRDLVWPEIVGQVLHFARLVKKEEAEDGGGRISNVVFMGMGEPFLNYDHVMEAVRVLHDPEGLNISERKLSISTIGLPDGIKRLAKEDLNVNLAVSLHAPEDELRTHIAPINARHPIREVLTAVEYYVKQKKRKVMFEYLLMDGVNDSVRMAEKLARLLRDPMYLVNLIVYNTVSYTGFRPSPRHRVREFKKVLEDAGLNVTERYRFGRGIKGACGQLAAREDA